MANDMNSAMDALKGILGDDAEDKIQSVMSSLAGGSNNSEKVGGLANLDTSGLNTGNLEFVMKIKNIMDQVGRSDDSRSRLLMSLKPYMRTGRQRSIDNAIKIMSLTKFTGFLK